MTGRLRAAYDRLGPWPVFVGCAAVGTATWTLALSSLVPLFRAMAAGAPLLVLAPHDAVGLPIGVSAFALAAVSLVPPPDKTKRRRAAPPPRIDWTVIGMVVVAVGVGLSFFASGIAWLAVDVAATRHGYAQCAPISGERPARVRWARGDPAAVCPVG